MKTLNKSLILFLPKYILLLSVILLFSSCEKYKQNNLMKKSSDSYLKRVTDSIYKKEFGLKESKVFTYTSGLLRQIKFKNSKNRDTTTMIRRLAIKGITGSGDMLKKEIEWKIRTVTNQGVSRIVGSESRVVRDISLLRQVLNSLLCTVIWFFFLISSSGGMILKISDKEMFYIFLFAGTQFITGIFLFGSFVISGLNALFFFFLLSSLFFFGTARSGK